MHPKLFSSLVQVCSPRKGRVFVFSLRFYLRYLGEDIGLAQVSGGNEASVPVAKLLEINQVLVMTHQLLLNTLTYETA